MSRTAPLTFLFALLFSGAVFACETCRPAVQAGIFDEHFWGRLAITLLPFSVILFIAVRLHVMRPGESRR